MSYRDDNTCAYRELCVDLLWTSFGMYEQIGYKKIQPDFPTEEDCSNLTGAFTSLAYSVQNWSLIEYPTFSTENMAACQILCGEADPRVLFLSLGASSPMATGMCIFVVALLVLASLYLLAAILQHEAQWIPTLGSLTMSAGFAFFIVLYSKPSSNPFMYKFPQPVIAAMNAAIFSYFFSGFQYAISPGYEFGPAVSLLAVGYPLWLKLVAVPHQFWGHPKSFPVFLAKTGLAMPIVSLIWIMHSALYRTIGYRAAWIRAWRLSEYSPADNSTPRKYMSSLWTLAAAQEQPTWRSTPGQSTGVLLLILAWIIAFNYDDTCQNENILLLKAMIYLPPMLLTVATIWNQVMISFFESNSNVVESFIQEYKLRKTAATPSDIKGQILLVIGSALRSTWSKLEVACPVDYTDSIIAYRLGRNVLYVESNINIYKGFQDTIFGFSLWIIEIGLQLLSLPIYCVLVLSRMCLRWVGAIGIGCILHFTRFYNFKCAVQQFCDAKRSTMNLHACEILYKHCGEDNVVWTTLEENLLPFEVDAKVRDILSKHSMKINLNELLRSSRPMELLYLLSHLDDVLASTRSLNIEQELELSDIEKPILKRYATFS